MVTYSRRAAESPQDAPGEVLEVDPDHGSADSPGLDALMQSAQSIEAGGPADPPRPTPIDLAAVAAGEARELVEVVASLALPVLPIVWPKHGAAVAAAYGPAQLDRIADALGQVAQKRGWSMADSLGKYGPEIALAAALLGPVLPVLLSSAKPPATDPGPATAPPQAPATDPGPPVDDGRVHG